MKTCENCRDFGFEVTKNPPLENENLRAGSWCVETNSCIPTDTI